MKKTHFLLIGCLAVTACQQKTSDASLALLLNTLENSKRVIEYDNQQIYWKIEGYERDPKTQGSAEHLKLVVLATQRISRDLVKYIGNLKEQKDKIDRKELMDKLATYKKALKDSLSPENYADSLFLRERLQYDLSWLKKLIDTSFKLPEVDRTAISRIEKEALIVENIIVRELSRHIGIIIEDVAIVDAFYNISSSYVKSGQQLVVTAVAGKIDLLRNQKVTIDGQVVKLNNEHVAVYTMTAHGRPGKHTIPVKTEFTWPDGKPGIINKSIEYEIAP